MILGLMVSCVQPGKAAHDSADSGRVDSVESPTDTDSAHESDTAHETDGETGQDSSDSGTTGRTWSVCATAPSDFTTLQDGLDEAVCGDTLELCAGEYEGAFGYDRVSVIGVGGSLATSIVGALDEEETHGDCAAATTFRGLTVESIGVLDGEDLRVEDVRIRGSRGRISINGAVTIDDFSMIGSSYSGPIEFGLLDIEANSVDIRHAVFEGNSLETTHADSAYIVNVWDDGPFTMHNCIFANNLATSGSSHSSTLSAGGSTTEIDNVVFYGNTEGDRSVSPVAMVWALQNSIIASNVVKSPMQTDIMDPAGYNLFWDNTHTESPNGFEPDELLPTDFEADPLLTDPASFDFTLLQGSPAIDGGNPDPVYNDTNGSPNDIGAFGGPDGDWVPVF